YEFISNLFKKADKMATLPATYLFDLLILLSVKLKKFNSNLVENILNKEITELYNLNFFYISVLINEMNIPKEFIMNILSQNALWNDKSFHLSLVCIVISSYKRRLISQKQIENISNSLDPQLKTILLSKCDIQKPSESSEENLLLN